MNKVLISVSDDLVSRLRVAIPTRQRGKVIACLIAKEIEQREKSLYSCALEIEKDAQINEEMKTWNITINDGLGEV